MARYIDKDRAKQEFSSICIDSWIFSELVELKNGRKSIEETNDAIQDTIFKEINRVINKLPEEVAPVIRGRWQKNKRRMAGEGYFVCSNCKIDSYNDTDYCCHCGAKMEGAKYGEH